MEYKQLRKRLSDITARDGADIDALVEGLAMIMGECGANLDSVAIPTFGTFVPTKHDEEIIDDLATGGKMLMPPEITLEFNPGGMLLKRLRNE